MSRRLASKGSFDCSYLSSLEEWLDMVVLLAWLKDALVRGISRKKLLKHIYNTYTNALFNKLD